MRSLLVTAAVALSLTACATQSPPPAAAPAPVASTAAPVVKVPACYNGDSGKFEALGTVTAISGVKVVCEKTSDGKSAQWMGVKK